MSANGFHALQELGDAMPESPRSQPEEDRLLCDTRTVQGHPKSLKKPLIWMDLEMTGLCPETDHILQIAVIITDGALRHSVEGPELAIHQPDSVLESMNDWCKQHHGASGLTQAVRESTLDVEAAETQILEFIQLHVPLPLVGNLAGSSIHVDLAFLRRYMPRIAAYCSHRIVDVSSIEELVRRWKFQLLTKRPKVKTAHTALSDIRDSIALLKYYKEQYVFFESELD